MNKEQNEKSKKEFDRSICFTFYNDFHEQIMDVKRDFGLEQAFEVYEAIVNCGLYGTEIGKGRLRTLVSNTTISKIEGSQENRARWFNGENFEQTKLVAEYMRDHPNASQRTIASATGVGKTKVGKVQKNIRESGLKSIQEYLDDIVYPNLNLSHSNNNSNNNIVTETKTDHRGQSSQLGAQTETASTKMNHSDSASNKKMFAKLSNREKELMRNNYERFCDVARAASDFDVTEEVVAMVLTEHQNAQQNKVEEFLPFN